MSIFPWHESPLDEWAICGMNHYHVNGEKFLYVSMTKDNVCITQEGKDEDILWLKLLNNARYVQSLNVRKD